MTACYPAPTAPTSRLISNSRQHRPEVLPPVPDRRLWETDKARAFEAGARWLLAVSRAA